MREHLRHAQPFQIVDRGAEPDRLRDRHGPGLELPRQVVPLRFRELDLADHLATAEERRHGLEQPAAPVECSDPGRPQHLVAREGHEIAVQLLHVDRAVRHALGRVHGEQRAGRVGGARDLGDRVHGAEHVRNVDHRDELRAPVGEQLGQRFQGQLATPGDRDEPQLDLLLLRQELPGHQVRMVLHLGEHDRVAHLEEPAAPGMGHQVQRLRAVAGEHDLARRGGTHQMRDATPRVFVGSRRPLGDVVDAAVDVGVVLGVVASHRLEHWIGLLRRGGAVEVGQRLRARRAEDRKLQPHLARVERQAGTRRARELGRRGRFSHDLLAGLQTKPSRSSSRSRAAGAHARPRGECDPAPGRRILRRSGAAPGCAGARAP